MHCAVVKVLGNGVFEVDGAKYKEVPFLECEHRRIDNFDSDACKTYLSESGYPTTFVDSKTKENADLGELDDGDHDFEIITSDNGYLPVKVMVLARDPLLIFEILESSIQIEKAYKAIFEATDSIDSLSDFVRSTGYFQFEDYLGENNGQLIINIFEFRRNASENVISFTRKPAFTNIGVLYTINDSHLATLDSTQLSTLVKSSETNEQLLIEKDAEIQTLADDNSLLFTENSQTESKLKDKQIQLDDLLKAHHENRYLTPLIVVTTLFGLALIATMVCLVRWV